MWARHRAMLFAGKSQAGAGHAHGWAGCRHRAGHLLGRQPAQSGQGQDRPPQEETGTRHLSSKHGSLCLFALQAERGSLASASAWSRSDGVRSFCLPGGVCLGTNCCCPAPTQWQIPHGQQLGFGAFTAVTWIWSPAREERFSV